MTRDNDADDGPRREESQDAAATDQFTHVARHVWSFALDQEDLRRAAAELQAYLVELARSASITFHAIDARAKELSSYEAKSVKTDDAGLPKYSNPASQIFDCVAARVIVFTIGARDAFVQLIESRTVIYERINPGKSKYNGYDSEHLIVTALSDDDARLRYPTLTTYLTRYPGLEIQLRSVAAHAWAEYEHDVRYKPGAYQDLPADDRKQIDQWFIEAGGMRRVLDSLFSDIEARVNSYERQAAVQPAPARPSGLTAGADKRHDLADSVSDEIDLTPLDADPVPIDSDALESFIRSRYPHSELGEGSEVASIATQLATLGIDTIAKVEAALEGVEDGRVARLMDYSRQTTAVRRLDDELLAALSQRYVEAELDSERAQLLRLRLRRVGGKFAIYSVHTQRSSSPPITAAHAVRLLAAFVAAIRGPQEASVEGVVSDQPDRLNLSAKAKSVRTRDHVVYVATNLTRSVAEDTMRTLVERIPGTGVRVLRAGDVLYSAPEEPAGSGEESSSDFGWEREA